MKRLRTLLLANNRLVGTIPDSWGVLSGLLQFDVTNNSLTGRPFPAGYLVLMIHKH